MKENNGRILDFKTEHGYEIKALFEVLKDVLHETTIQFIQGDGATKPQHKKVESDDEEEVPVKRGRKPKNPPKPAVKHAKKKPVVESDSDDISDVDSDEISDSSEEDVKKKTNIKSPKKPVKKSSKSDSDEDESNDDTDDKSADDTDEDKSDKDEKPTSKKDSIEPAKDKSTDKKKPAGGIKILTVNDNKTLILYVKLLSQNFLEFNCKYENYDIGIDLVQVYNYLRNIDKDGILNGYIEEADKQRIVFQVVNTEKGSESKYRLKLMDINKKEYEIPPPDFDMVVHMKTEEFHKMCRDMATIGSYMAITCSDKKIEFACKGNVSDLNKTYINGDNVKIMGSSDKKGDKKGEVKIVREVYELRNLLLFNKCTNLCDNIQILLKNRYPLFIRYTVASLGDMTVGLVPIDETALTKNTNYDEGDDKYYEDEDKVKMKDL
jgi:proliferating cell nuclear antigen